MSDTASTPVVVFLAFANDRSGNGAGYLRNLPDEARRLRKHLEQAQQQTG